MFDIGFWEMAVIGVMALLILGPERLPGAIKSTMSTVRSIKQMAAGFKAEVSSQIDAHELHANLKKAEELGMQNIGKDLQESVDELKAAAESVQRPYQKKLDNDAPNPDEAADISSLLPNNVNEPNNPKHDVESSPNRSDSAANNSTTPKGDTTNDKI